MAGDLASAETFYEKAVSRTEDIRSGLLPSERKNFFEVKIGGFYRFEPARGLSRVRMKLKRPEQSLGSSELVRARAFSDHLGYSGLPEKILQEEDEALTTLAALKKTLASIPAEQEADKFSNIEELTAAATQRLNDFIERLRKEYPHYAAVKYPQPMSLKQALLKPDEHVVYLDFLGEGVGVTLIRGKEVLKSFYRPWQVVDLLQSISNLRMPFETFQLEKFDVELASGIYRKIFEGVLDDVSAGTPLCIIPDGPLAVIPFEALVVSGRNTWKKGKISMYPDGVTYLGDVYPINYEKSLTSMSLSRLAERSGRAQPKDRLLVLADPVFKVDDPRVKDKALVAKITNDDVAVTDFNRILEQSAGGRLEFKRAKETGALADSLSKIYGPDSLSLTGLNATKADFLNNVGRDLNEFKWIVFATHGVFLGQNPGLEPFLALTMVPPSFPRPSVCRRDYFPQFASGSSQLAHVARFL